MKKSEKDDPTTSGKLKVFRLLRWLIPVLVTLLVFEIGLRVAVGQDVYFLKRILVPYDTAGLDSAASLIKYDKLRGWALNPFVRRTAADGQTMIHPVNSLGMRDPSEYGDQAGAGIHRIAIFGDSFTYGFEVTREQSYPYLLQQLGHRLEVLNFGVPGYGTDQAYLSYRKLRAERPHFAIDTVIVGFTIENIYRNINILRPAYSMTSGLPFTKPRYIIADDDSLKLANIPPLPPDKLADLYRHPEQYPILEHETFRLPAFAGSCFASLYLFRFLAQATDMIRRLFTSNRNNLATAYNADSEPFRITSAILRQFCLDATAAGSNCLVLLIPGAGDLALAEQGSLPWASLTDFLQLNEIPYLDLSERLISALSEGRNLSDIYIDGIGHFTKTGNQIVAKSLFEQIAR